METGTFAFTKSNYTCHLAILLQWYTFTAAFSRQQGCDKLSLHSYAIQTYLQATAACLFVKR